MGRMVALREGDREGGKIVSAATDRDYKERNEVRRVREREETLRKRKKEGRREGGEQGGREAGRQGSRKGGRERGGREWRRTVQAPCHARAAHP